MAGTRSHHPMLFGILALAGAVVLSPAARAADPELQSILIDKFAFVPERVAVRAGDTVEWKNRDIAPHEVTDVDGVWRTGELTNGQSARVSFDVPGTYAYSCSYHPQMHGEIVVGE